MDEVVVELHTAVGGVRMRGEEEERGGEERWKAERAWRTEGKLAGLI